MLGLVGIACRVRVLREAQGFSVDEFARLASVSYDFVLDVNSGLREVQFAVYLRIASALGVDPAFLLFGLDGARDFYESCSQLQLERFTECARLCSL